MSRCLLCLDAPELTRDELLKHLHDTHGTVALTDARTARARVTAAGTILAVILLIGVFATVYLALLVALFTQIT